MAGSISTLGGWFGVTPDNYEVPERTHTDDPRGINSCYAELLTGQKSSITEMVFSDRIGAKHGFLRYATMTWHEVHLAYTGIASSLLSKGRAM